ncbi:hypothetical protein DPMN_012815 [Dreissena polymorpha]|uniref:Nuclease HARBI1 n=1 Tax=Dreissena polymorpha TaxID=45954 RepID=A0A9D4N6Q0_DREPO|nr:hypothetical protein DPMN_012815 [Dreissena polymorpha]
MTGARRQLRFINNTRIKRVFLDRTNTLQIYGTLNSKNAIVLPDWVLFLYAIFARNILEGKRCGSLPVPVVLAVCIYLWYVASGDLQLTVGDNTGLSQATVSRVCAQISNSLAAKVPEFVKFPAGVDAVRTKQELGAIAGT